MVVTSINIGVILYVCIEVHPPVILTNNLGSGAMAYNGQTVKFMCMVKIVVHRGIVVTWRSDDYIGIGRTDDVLYKCALMLPWVPLSTNQLLC